MNISQDQNQQLLQTQKIAPHLIQASEILQCSTMELSQVIELELLENPALESAETSADICPGCPASLFCERCPFGSTSGGSSILPTKTTGEIEPEPAIPTQTTELRDADAKEAAEEGDPDQDIEIWTAPEANSYYVDGVDGSEISDESYDPVALASSRADLRESVLSTVRSMVRTPEELRVVEFLVISLDERGWLKIDDAEVMAEFGIDEATLARCVGYLQACDPAGIGARDLRECILLQLDQKAAEGAGNDLLRQMVAVHWDEVVQRRYPQLARKTRTTVKAVEEAMEFLQSEITPNPAGAFRDPWDYKPDNSSEAVRPDVLIKRTAMGFEVEVLGGDLPTLHINARYRMLYEVIKAEHESAASRPTMIDAETRRKTLATTSLQERRHIVAFVERANLFLRNIQQRKRTMQRITECLIESQQGFIETGSRAFLLPLTRTELAQRLNVHESTVSRALLRKFVQLPNQDVISFDEFFTPAGSIKDSIVHLIAGEDPTNPFSDERIRQLLAAAGQGVARRTVVKYREAMRIPASYMRRRHG